MHTADYAIVTEEIEPNRIRYKARCPKCGKVDESNWLGQQGRVNPKGRTTTTAHCPYCHERFTITFYGI